MKSNRSLSAPLSRLGRYLLEKSVGAGGWMRFGDEIPKAWPADWWQRDYHSGQAADFGSFAPIVACLNIISQDLSRIPLTHVRDLPDGSVEPVTGKAPMRVFRRPNGYQVKADWIRYLVLSVLSDGNSYNYVVRNDRFEIEEFYPLHPRICRPYLTPEGEVLYRVSADPTTTLAGVEEGLWVPARDMLHIRGATPKHPLIGESPLVAAVAPTITGTQINNHIAAFFSNMGRPSGILRHPGRLSEQAMQRIKGHFKDAAAGRNTGEIVVLSENMDWAPLTMSAVDAAIADMYRLSERQIFQIFRVPPFLAGDLDRANITNVEELTRFYLLSGLAAWENLIEEWLTRIFNLPTDERIAFDIERALLQGDLKTRIDAYARGVQAGIYAPNEVRRRERLPPVEYGDYVRVQQQMVVLSSGEQERLPSPPEEEQLQARLPRPATPAAEDIWSEEEQLSSDEAVQLQYAKLKQKIDGVFSA